MEPGLTSDLGGTVLVRRGKVKDIYELAGGRFLFHFTDRVSAFDVVLPTPIPDKGKILCLFAEYWFETLGAPHHMVARVGPDRMVVKRLTMIPVECVVRGFLYGSLYERCRSGKVAVGVPLVLASALPAPLFDPTTKSEVRDEPVTEEEAVRLGLCGREEFQRLGEVSIRLYREMAEVARRADFIIADLKLEFGTDAGGGLVLADSIGPDEFRLWQRGAYAPGRAQEAYDKQIVRDWLIEQGYKRQVDEAFRRGERPPVPPELPAVLVEQVRGRYIEAYERLTGRRFR